MTTVSVKNNGQGLRSFPDIDGRSVVLKPGETRTIEMHSHHVMLLERASAKLDPGVIVEMHADERKDYQDEIDEQRAVNRANRMAKRTRNPATPLPPVQRQPRVDKRFFQDPRTVHPDEIKPVDSADYTIKPREPPPAPAAAAVSPRVKAKKSQPRVALKK